MTPPPVGTLISTDRRMYLYKIIRFYNDGRFDMEVTHFRRGGRWMPQPWPGDPIVHRGYRWDDGNGWHIEQYDDDPAGR